MGDNSSQSMQEQYFSWLSNCVSRSTLSEWYFACDEIDKWFTDRHILKAPLLQTTDMTILLEIRDTIERNKFFRKTHKRDLGKMSLLIRHYITFIKKNGYITHSAQSPPEEEKHPEPSKSTVIAESTPSQAAIETVDLSEEREYSFTTPVSFSYFGNRSSVTSWRKLYINCILLLLEDYPSIVQGMRGSSILGSGKMDISDFADSAFMRFPGKVADHVYVETNFNATDLMKRLRRLLIMCNVDFENLQISFRRQSSSGQAVKNEKVNALQPRSKTDVSAEFVEWMLANGIEQSTSSGYVFLLRQLDDLVKRKGYLSESIFFVVSVPELKSLQKRLNLDSEFLSHNLRQRHRFDTALKNYIEYCMVRNTEVPTEPANSAEVTALQFKSKADVSSEFMEWMLANGMAKATSSGYVSSLRQIDEFAKKKGRLSESVFFIVSVSFFHCQRFGTKKFTDMAE